MNQTVNACQLVYERHVGVFAISFIVILFVVKYIYICVCVCVCCVCVFGRGGEEHKCNDGCFVFLCIMHVCMYTCCVCVCCVLVCVCVSIAHADIILLLYYVLSLCTNRVFYTHTHKYTHYHSHIQRLCVTHCE
eukprot:GHVR01121564.1.p1 GENE.GHVR01121564.1~~GHVR01121564.1.p1  ORF type:complete len:134 (+),score=37.74 GHVR01121564.1:422-823(+)